MSSELRSLWDDVSANSMGYLVVGGPCVDGGGGPCVGGGGDHV